MTVTATDSTSRKIGPALPGRARSTKIPPTYRAANTSNGGMISPLMAVTTATHSTIAIARRVSRRTQSLPVAGEPASVVVSVVVMWFLLSAGRGEPVSGLAAVPCCQPLEGGTID